MNMTNFEVALKEEMKRVIRCFQAYTSEQRANHAASHRLGYQQRKSMGEFFYVHPSAPDRAFTSRKRAALSAIGSHE